MESDSICKHLVGHGHNWRKTCAFEELDIIITIHYATLIIAEENNMIYYLSLLVCKSEWIASTWNLFGKRQITLINILVSFNCTIWSMESYFVTRYRVLYKGYLPVIPVYVAIMTAIYKIHRPHLGLFSIHRNKKSSTSHPMTLLRLKEWQRYLLEVIPSSKVSSLSDYITFHGTNEIAALNLFASTTQGILCCIIDCPEIK